MFKTNNKDIKTIRRFLDKHEKGLENFLSFLSSKDEGVLDNLVESYIDIRNQLQAQINSIETLRERIENADIQDITNKITSIERILSYKILFNDVIGRLHHNIERNTTFNERLEINRDSKLVISKQFVKIPEVYNAIKNNDSVFFESGTTLSYSTLSILDNIKKIREDDLSDHSPILKICTNNAIIYMITLFEEIITPSLLPGKPKNQYNGTYGNPDSYEECDSQKVKEFLEKNNIETLFTTSSFLDINYGPHVSSVPNCEVKQICNKYLLEVNHDLEKKNILVIASEHINKDISEKRINLDCRLVFSDDASKTINNYSEVELGRIKNDFRSFLDKPNVFIVTGSIDFDLCRSVTRDLREEYPFLTNDYYPIEDDNSKGGISVIYKSRRS